MQEHLFKQIESSMASQSGFDSSKITLKTNENCVTMTGKVNSALQRNKAETWLHSQAGVKLVVNRLQVRGQEAQTLSGFLDDAFMAAEIKTKLISKRGASFFNVKVEAHSGLIKLSGFTNSDEHYLLAEEIARSFSGVCDVLNSLSIKYN